jgi:hypothetical protein
VVAAGQDRIVRAESFRHIKAARPDVEIETVPGPHLLLQAAPERAWPVIERFVDAAKPE